MVHRIKEEDIHKSSRFLKKNDPKRKGLKLKEISNFLNEGHVSEIISEENFAKKNKKSINVFAHTIIYKNKKSRINNIVISPKTTEIGLHIHSLKIFALPEKRTFQYKLMLTQAQKKVKTAIGKVLLSIDGMQGSKPVILKMSTFSKEYAGGHVYKFKYFQKFEGIIKLPENYVSKIVSVTLKPKYGKKVVKKEFDWPIK